MSENETEGTGWRVWSGAGLLRDAPLGDGLRLAHAREDERERQAAQRAAELRAQAVAEKLGELRMAGREPRTQAEFLAEVSRAQDRQDKIDAKREAEAAELMGKPEPRLHPWELKQQQQQREAEALITPASKADVSKLSQSVTSLASKVGLLGRRQSEEQDSSGRRESPEEYARAYCSGVRMRNGGGIIRGPY
jgi:hypothetical protein